MKLRWIPLFALLPLVLGASAPLTWQDCVNEARAKNPDLITAEEAKIQAFRQHLANFSQFLPKVNYSAGYGQGAGYNPTDNTFASGLNSDNWNSSLSASETIFNGFGRLASLDRTRAALDQAEASLADTRATVAFNLRSAFTSLLFSQNQTALNDDIVKRRAEDRDLVELRFESGRENKGAYLQAKAYYSMSVYDAGKARQGQVISSSTLARLLGRRQGDDLEVQGDLKSGDLPEEIKDFNSLASDTPAHHKNAAQLAQAKAALRGAQAALWPTVSANASLSRPGSDTWPPQTGSWSAGVSLNWNLFDGGSDLLNWAAAGAGMRAAEASVLSSDDTILISLRQDYFGFISGVNYAQASAEMLDAAQARAEIARAQYTNGLLTFDIWDQIENTLIDSQKQELAARRDAVLAKASWEHTSGKGF
jgi:outer membrane protein TolC